METDVTKIILSEKQELVSIPQTLSEVIRVVGDEHASSDDLAEVLARDPALTASLLRIVNTPFYGGNRKIGDVRQAVVIVGIRQVTALALSASVYQLTKDWKSSIDRVRFWRHSLQVAIGSRLIAELAGYPRPEEMFVTGLLHDIGIMILEQSFPEAFEKVWQESANSDNPVDLEEEEWGTNHALVGQFLLEQWRLPEAICQGVGRHHVVYTPGATELDLRPGQIVSLADILSTFRTSDLSAQTMAQRRENRATLRDNLVLDNEQLIDIEKSLFGRTVTEAKFLEIEIGSTDELLGETNRLLIGQQSEVEKLLNESRHLHQQVAQERLSRTSVQTIITVITKFADQLQETIDALEPLAGAPLSTEADARPNPETFTGESSIRLLAQVDSLRALVAQMKHYAQGEMNMDYGNEHTAPSKRRLEASPESKLQPEPA